MDSSYIGSTDTGYTQNRIFRTLLLLCLLVYAFWAALSMGLFIHRLLAMVTLLSYIVVYLLFVYLPTVRWTTKRYIAATLLLVIESVAQLLMFGGQFTDSTPLFFLIGLIGTRIPGRLSVYLASSIIFIVGLLILVCKPFSPTGNIG